MSFREPLLLLALALLPLAIAAYVLAQRRRKSFALRYTNVDVLAAVAGRSWGRHVPGRARAARAAGAADRARPARAHRRRAAAPGRGDHGHRHLGLDGGHRRRPDRLAAAQEAARALAKKLPEEFNLGLVSFNNVAEQLVAPTTDRNQIYAAIDGLKVRGSTAMGDGLELGLQTRAHAGQRQRRPRAAAARRCSCCSPTARASAAPSRSTIADRAKKLKIPIYTIALGTQSGRARPQRPLGAGAARQRDAARHRRDDRRALLRRPERGAARVDLREPRHALLDEEGQAGGHVVVRGRRAGAAAGRPPCSRCCGWGGSREPPRPAASPRPSARPSARPRPDPAAASCARSTSPCCGGSRACPRRAPHAAGRRRHRARDDPPLPPGRRRAPHRLERDRADARAARARARRRARDDRVAAARRVGLDDVRHRRPPQGRRRRGRRAGDRPRGDAARQPPRRRRARRRRAAHPAPAPGPPRAARAAGRAARRARGRRRRARPRSAPRSQRTAALARNRGLVVVVSDFRGERDWEDAAADAARAPRRARGRDPRPARAGAAAGRRPLADRSRDRAASCTSTRTSGACASASRRRRPRSARRSRRRCGAPAPTTSCSRRAATGCATLAGHLQRSELRVRGGRGGRRELPRARPS